MRITILVALVLVGGALASGFALGASSGGTWLVVAPSGRPVR